MLRDLLLVNGLFDYLTKIENDIEKVKVLDCDIYDRYNNKIEIRIEFRSYCYSILVCDNYVEIENTDSRNRKIYFDTVMDLINILEKFRKSIDNFE